MTKNLFLGCTFQPEKENKIIELRKNWKVINTHRGKILHAIIAPNSPQSIHVRHEGHPATGHVHALYVTPSENRMSILKFRKKLEDILKTH